MQEFPFCFLSTLSTHPLFSWAKAITKMANNQNLLSWPPQGYGGIALCRNQKSATVFLKLLLFSSKYIHLCPNPVLVMWGGGSGNGLGRHSVLYNVVPQHRTGIIVEFRASGCRCKDHFSDSPSLCIDDPVQIRAGKTPSIIYRQGICSIQEKKLRECFHLFHVGVHQSHNSQFTNGFLCVCHSGCAGHFQALTVPSQCSRWYPTLADSSAPPYRVPS